MRSIKRSLIAALLLPFVILTAALGQPGDYVPRITAIVNALQKRIGEVSVEIDKQPNDLQLYAKRASLYAELYHALYDEGGLGVYYGKPPELSVDALTTKAISDFDRAISKFPSVDLFTKRAEMHEARWSPVALEIFYGAGRMKDWPSDSWEPVVEASTYELERAILNRVLTNKDFNSASEDYSAALRLNTDDATAREIHTRLAGLYFFRATRMPLNVPLVRATVIRPNTYGYSLLGDYDKAIEHMSRGNSPSECKLWSVSRGRSLCDYYLAKGGAAVEYLKYELALQAFSAAEEYIEKDDRGRRCWLYAARRDLHAKLKNFDAALADVAQMNSTNSNLACGDDGYRVRADAAFEKGDWHGAIDNYTKVLAVAGTDPDSTGRLNLIRAYLNLGDPKGALAELKNYCGIGCAAEFLQLQARAHQMLGQTALAAREMKTFRDYQAFLKEEEKLKANSRIVYGRLELPGEMKLGKGSLLVAVVDPVTGAFIRQCQTHDLQRFSIRYWMRRPFRIKATYEENGDGSQIKLSGETKNLIISDHNIGPLTLELKPSS